MGKNRFSPLLPVLTLALLPPLAAICAVGTFVTQDGPTHLYNAHILARSLSPPSPFEGVFAIRWEPVPNWAGHLVSMALVSAVPPVIADRCMTLLTFLALVASSLLLRVRVAGSRGLQGALVFSTILGLNVCWLFGFSSFLLGASLFPLTLAFWWSSRLTRRPMLRAASLAGLVVLGYFCHLVSLGLTAFGVVMLELFTPGPRRALRAGTTFVGLSPLAPLSMIYYSLMRRGGGVAPEWKHLPSPLSPSSWLKQLSFVDPISLARRDVLPFRGDDVSSPWFALATPVVWLAVALGMLFLAAWRERAAIDADSSADFAGSRGWWPLAMLLIIAGIASPDTLGAAHGEYLQQRVVLLGLVALVPVLPFESKLMVNRYVGIPALIIAMLLQSATIWDYALTSERLAGAVARSGSAVGNRRRVIYMLANPKTKFRANPLLHADGLLGVGTDNVLWNNYETRYYYFPVHFRTNVVHPDTVELEDLARSDDPGKIDAWDRLLEKYHDITDVVLSWGVDPALDAVTRKWFVLTEARGEARVFTKADPFRYSRPIAR